MEREEFVIPNSLIRRDIIVRYEGVERRVTQLQMMNWPDHSIPEDDAGYVTIESIVNCINDYRLTYTFSPILVHCRYCLLSNLFSAGTGRSGTLIGLYNIIRSLSIYKIINQSIEQKNIRVKPFFSVFNVVRKLREQRVGMVSSYIQYKYIYEYIVEYIKRNFDLYKIDDN